MQVTSNASRDIYRFTTPWSLRSSTKKIEYRRLSRAGKGLTGRTVVHTKSALLRRYKKPRINYSHRLKVLTFVYTLKLVPFENKLVALVVLFPLGLSYVQVNDNVKIFDMLYFPVTNPRVKRFFRKPSFFLLQYITKLMKVSLLELYPGGGIQYARSAGVAGKIIRFDYSAHTALIKLPSGVRKFFSLYSLVTPDPVALKVKRNWKNTKSGYWRSFGVKPKVRGVAQNPVDHPHGGRTKSIKYPRTPWGKTTKRK